MTLPGDLFSRANARCHRRAYEQWHRRQSKQHILRSQVGFADPTPSRPLPCRQCANYHGVAYGTSRARRHTLICAMHPYGWLADSPCPDWQA
ncbi:hypothetical protein GFS31_17110 [Leptolyngbya sp. BL0902]|uniref:hypothetical protein n=1 Tax=Leptolyngbya sp. BL0902 TaxID=1115757 RepID=UPI0018E8A9E9|nr:hypothetical protein [Leptolyngbya sp. BL0902]QQE65026.1 hypothetical protein GFS31_17110 [Leptolyngbya sp. BL0902]